MRDLFECATSFVVLLAVLTIAAVSFDLAPLAMSWVITLAPIVWLGWFGHSVWKADQS